MESIAKEIEMVSKMLNLAIESKNKEAITRYVNRIGYLLNQMHSAILDFDEDKFKRENL